MTYPANDRPDRIPELFAAAWNRRDADMIASLFEEEAEFVNVTGLWWHDREAIRVAHAYGLERIFPESTLRLGRVKVTSLTDRIAVVHARMHLSGQSSLPGTEHPRERTTIFSFVVREGPTGWRCVSAQNTDVVPGAETNLIDADGNFRSVSYRRAGEH